MISGRTILFKCVYTVYMLILFLERTLESGDRSNGTEIYYKNEDVDSCMHALE